MSAESSPFRVATLLALIVVGVGGLLALIGIGAWAPDMQAADSGGGHALSRGATGFAGLVRLAGETGRDPRILRDTRAFARTDTLLVITPELGSVNIIAAMTHADHAPTLVVLPKWQTAPDPDRAGWVRTIGPLPTAEPAKMFAPDPMLIVARRPGLRGQWLESGIVPAMRAPAQLQVITGVDLAHSEAPIVLHPLLTDGHGGIVLARVGDRALFVLADPDLIDNAALADEHQAAAALEMLDGMTATRAPGIAFDVSYNGLGARSPLRLLFEPPFAGATACLALALLLAGAAALTRFGPALAPARAIPFGKTALVDNAALMIRKAGREAEIGARYAEVMRQQAAGTHPKAGRFAELADAARAARGREEMLAAAQALHRWETTGETKA